jgi:hypothetical protein
MYLFMAAVCTSQTYDVTYEYECKQCEHDVYEPH